MKSKVGPLDFAGGLLRITIARERLITAVVDLVEREDRIITTVSDLIKLDKS